MNLTAPLVEQAQAKINLTLRVIGRRADGYHELESLVAFATLADTLVLQPGAIEKLDVSGPYAASSGPIADNLVLKAQTALRRYVQGLKAGRFVLNKNIPVAAGLGGGSADAAAALRLLARLNELAPDDARLMQAALEVGADVPVCLATTACIMRGTGESLSPPLELPSLAAVLVNPGVALATGDVFAKFTAQDGGMTLGEIPHQSDALLDFLAQHGNDLTLAAIANCAAISDVLASLSKLPGVRLARMSGSGATCFALFASADAAASAAKAVASAHKNWWVCSTMIN
ncbi:MAG: 4-(cytidine 5'-diphospho)-2-C-methyl-D-erythritol kinase [Pseudolabrys sp.]